LNGFLLRSKDGPAVFAFVRQRSFWKWLFFSLAPVVVIVVVLLGVQTLGRWTRSGLRSSEQYQLLFADIDCQPPPALNRADFLNQVQFAADLPEHLALLADEWPGVLQRAFSRHPWVESVQRIEVLPNRQVRVQLVHRTPVLAVLQMGEKRAIDSHGVLLPKAAVGEDLPVYCSPVSPPLARVQPGAVWGDATLESAARTIAYLAGQPQAPRFALVESAVSGLVLTTPAGSRVLWGRPAGRRQTADQRKRDRLLEYCRKYGDLDHPNGPCEHDLRSLD
jgi:hypothetical protein